MNSDIYWYAQSADGSNTIMVDANGRDVKAVSSVLTEIAPYESALDGRSSVKVRKVAGYVSGYIKTSSVDCVGRTPYALFVAQERALVRNDLEAVVAQGLSSLGMYEFSESNKNELIRQIHLATDDRRGQSAKYAIVLSLVAIIVVMILIFCLKG